MVWWCFDNVQMMVKWWFWIRVAHSYWSLLSLNNSRLIQGESHHFFVGEPLAWTPYRWTPGVCRAWRMSTTQQWFDLDFSVLWGMPPWNVHEIDRLPIENADGFHETREWNRILGTLLVLVSVVLVCSRVRPAPSNFPRRKFQQRLFEDLMYPVNRRYICSSSIDVYTSWDDAKVLKRSW